MEEVRKVKRFENGFIEDPVTISPEEKISVVAKIRKDLGYKKVPVVDGRGKLVGLIADVDYFMPDDGELKVKQKMQPLKDLKIAKGKVDLEQANKMIREYRLKTLCVADQAGKLLSIVTRKDIEKNEEYPNACKNKLKQLRVGAAVSVGETAVFRAEALIKAGVDVIVIDTAHGHSAGVLNTLKILKKKFKDQQIIAGNIATAAAALELIEAGADGVKVGIGPGSICTTRIVSGIGVPQLSAVMAVAEAIKKLKKQVPIIADGGIKHSGDIVKALAAGASAVMMGNMFAGTDESPGRVEFIGGRMYKVYRGMGSIEAMERGSKDRYGQGDVKDKGKFVPEGVSGRVSYKGPVARILYQLSGGLRSGLGYCGSKTIPILQDKAEFVKVSDASLRENHPHDLTAINSAPNYQVEE